MDASVSRSFRCSSLPLLLSCPASAIQPKFRTSTNSVESRLGTAAHEHLAGFLSGQELDIRTLSVKHGVSEEELRAICETGRAAWNGVLKQHFPNPQAEVSLSMATAQGIELTGRIDCLSVVQEEAVPCRTVHVLDWKTGHEDLDWSEQMKGYCWLAMCQNQPCLKAYSCVARLRDGTIEGDWYTMDELSSWWQHLVGSLANLAESYNPGAHCRRCPRSLECAPRKSVLRNAFEIVLGYHGLDLKGELADKEDHEIFRLLEETKTVECLASSIREAIKTEVASRGGRICSGDGREIVLSLVKHQKIKFSQESFDVLSKFMSREELYDCISVSKTRLERAISGQHDANGEKGGTIENVMRKLEDIGSVHFDCFERLDCKRLSRRETTNDK